MKLAKAKARRATARGKLPPPPPMAPAPPAPARSDAADATEEAVDGAVPAPPAAVNISLPLMPLAPSHWFPLPSPSASSRPSPVGSRVGDLGWCYWPWWRSAFRLAYSLRVGLPCQ